MKPLELLPIGPRCPHMLVGERCCLPDGHSSDMHILRATETAFEVRWSDHPEPKRVIPPLPRRPAPPQDVPA